MSITSMTVEKHGHEYEARVGHTFYKRIPGNETDREEPAFVEIHAVAIFLCGHYRPIKVSPDLEETLQDELLSDYQ